MPWETWKNSSPERKLLWIALSAVWFVLLLWAARGMDFTNPYLPFAVAGGLVFYLRTAPKPPEQAIWILASAAFAPVVRFPHAANWIVSGSCVLALAGFAAFLMLGLRWLWSQGTDRRRTVALLAPAAAMVFFVFSAQRALSLANLLYPKTYDLYLYVFDGSFGFQPSFLLGRAMASSLVFRTVSVLTYLSLPFVMALVYAFCVPRDAERPSWDVISLLMLAGLGGWALYNLVPATGPVYVFGSGFPWQSLPYRTLPRLFLEQIPVTADAPRNAIPSLHLAWVLLLYWNTRGQAVALRVFLAVYLALTVASTLGTGEHYFVDLVAGVPFALMVQAILSPGTRPVLARRVIAASSGLALTFAWLLLVRFGVKAMLVSPILPWSLALATVGGAWALNRWLVRASSTKQAGDLPPAPSLALGAHG